MSQDGRSRPAKWPAAVHRAPGPIRRSAGTVILVAALALLPALAAVSAGSVTLDFGSGKGDRTTPFIAPPSDPAPIVVPVPRGPRTDVSAPPVAKPRTPAPIRPAAGAPRARPDQTGEWRSVARDRAERAEKAGSSVRPMRPVPPAVPPSRPKPPGSVKPAPPAGCAASAGDCFASRWLPAPPGGWDCPRPEPRARAAN